MPFPSFDMTLEPLAAYFIAAAGLKFAAAACMSTKSRPPGAEHVGTVSELVLYPLKSGHGISLQTVECTAQGARHPQEPVFDRTLMVLDIQKGTFVSGRQEPKLTTLQVTLDKTGIQIRDPSQMTSFHVPFDTSIQSGEVHTVNVWGTHAEGVDLGPEAAKWINQVFGKQDQYRLMYHIDGCKKRDLTKAMEHQFYTWTSRAGTAKDKVAFQDGYPYLLASEASLTDVNSHLTKPVTMKHMRPNIVVTGCSAFAEDNWGEIWIGKVKFSNVKPCDRCVLTTVDPVIGEKRADTEPLKSMRSYRILHPQMVKPLFGVNLVLDSEDAEIRVGDPVYVLPQKKPF